ncbi:MAG: zinc-ribbon domain, partial [Planctomycetota bacterium]
MAITVNCPACSARMTLRDDLAGKKIRCPKCQQALRVPDASAAVDSGESKPPA